VRAAVLAVSLACLAGAASAQGIEGKVGRFYEGDGWTLYRLGLSRPLVGPLGTTIHGDYMERVGSAEGAFAGRDLLQHPPHALGLVLSHQRDMSEATRACRHMNHPRAGAARGAALGASRRSGPSPDLGLQRRAAPLAAPALRVAPRKGCTRCCEALMWGLPHRRLRA